MHPFIEAIVRRHGNPRAIWCNRRLLHGQKIKIVWEIKGEPCFIDGIATGYRNKRSGLYAVRIINPANGKQCIIHPKKRNILVQW